MPRLPRFARGTKFDLFGKKRIKKDVRLFVEDLNFWLDKVFLYQRNKTDREAERFMRQLYEYVGRELGQIIGERELDCEQNRSRRKKTA
jgi:hypothetical protein